METAWIPVTFTRSLRIGWNWDDLMQDATAAKKDMNLAAAGLVLSRNAEISALTVEATLRQLGGECGKHAANLIKRFHGISFCGNENG